MTLIEELGPTLQVLRYAVEYPQAGILRVTGYVSTSTKEVIDYDLRCITQEDYQDLAAKSLLKIKQLNYKVPDLPKEVVIPALDELVRSLQYAAEKGGGDAPTPGERLHADMVGGIYYKDEGRKLVLKQLLVLKKTVTVAAPINPRARGSQPKTLAKNAIREQTPINDYLGRIDLALGKFKKVEIVT